jgi:hypothetical protein
MQQSPITDKPIYATSATTRQNMGQNNTPNVTISHNSQQYAKISKLT